MITINIIVVICELLTLRQGPSYDTPVLLDASM